MWFNDRLLNAIDRTKNLFQKELSFTLRLIICFNIWTKIAGTNSEIMMQPFDSSILYVKSRLNSRTPCVYFPENRLTKIHFSIWNDYIQMKFKYKFFWFFFLIKIERKNSSDPVLCVFKTENVSQMERLLKVSFRVVISL